MQIEAVVLQLLLQASQISQNAIVQDIGCWRRRPRCGPSRLPMTWCSSKNPVQITACNFHLPNSRTRSSRRRRSQASRTSHTEAICSLPSVVQLQHTSSVELQNCSCARFCAGARVATKEIVIMEELQIKSSSTTGIHRRALDGCGDEPKLRTEKITSSHANTDMNQHKTPRTLQNRTKREQSLLPRKVDLQNMFVTNVGVCVSFW